MGCEKGIGESLKTNNSSPNCPGTQASWKRLAKLQPSVAEQTSSVPGTRFVVYSNKHVAEDPFLLFGEAYVTREISTISTQGMCYCSRVPENTVVAQSGTRSSWCPGFELHFRERRTTRPLGPVSGRSKLLSTRQRQRRGALEPEDGIANDSHVVWLPSAAGLKRLRSLCNLSLHWPPLRCPVIYGPGLRKSI
ncbi:hypothetical protein SKAU_G00242630 [Synaphobranchus kaupii]|uniref:Uncharacterized protein n=1 Tax=Synaphobranchus kaupii TaxID=118154 RepID=A0A9Q1F7R6_SYNKA|nr:hypothetical protein SKAU_G00242630 [Synaphobranchus kaupii]